MKWIKASERLPKEHTWVVFQWEDTKAVFREKPFNLRDENGNIGGIVYLKWLDESDQPNSVQEEEDWKNKTAKFDKKFDESIKRNSVQEGEKEAVEGWIRVEDGLPDYEKEVLVFGTILQRSPQMGGNPPVVVITMRQDLKGSLLEKNKRRYLDENDFRHFEKVTHWMPLPAPPQQ